MSIYWCIYIYTYITLKKKETYLHKYTYRFYLCTDTFLWRFQPSQWNEYSHLLDDRRDKQESVLRMDSVMLLLRSYFEAVIFGTLAGSD